MPAGVAKELSRSQGGRGGEEGRLASAREPVANPNPTTTRHRSFLNPGEERFRAAAEPEITRHPSLPPSLPSHLSFFQPLLLPQKETNTRPWRLPLFLPPLVNRATCVACATKFTDELAHAHGPHRSAYEYQRANYVPGEEEERERGERAYMCVCVCVLSRSPNDTRQE